MRRDYAFKEHIFLLKNKVEGVYVNEYFLLSVCI